MASHTTTFPGRTAASPPARHGANDDPRPMSVTSEQGDGHALISVIYHALQEAATCKIYAQDARRIGNERLAAFFEACREEHNRRAVLGRRLVAADFVELDEPIEVEEEIEVLMDDGERLQD